MTKNISISEGSKSAQFGPVRRLVTSLQSEGTCAWVPEDETRTKTLSVRENGTYYPEEGYYGFSKVTVNVPKGISGNPTNSEGLDPEIEYCFEVDEGGNVDVSELPSSIAVATLPTDTSYTEGEPISLSGIAVTAYKGNGSVWNASGYAGGAIPTSELSFNPTIAPSVWDDPRLPVRNASGAAHSVIVDDELKSSSADLLQYSHDTSTSTTTVRFRVWQLNGTTYVLVDSGVDALGSGIVVGPNVAVYRYADNSRDSQWGNPNDGISGAIVSSDASENQISISWQRPSDRNTLSTTFQIDVVAAS